MNEKLHFLYDSEVFIDLYSELDVDINAEIEEIKLAYIKLAKKTHPDQGGSNELFQKITRAYEILYNKELRKEYDLYYLKKNMEEFKTDDYIRLKNDFVDFIDSNKKNVTKDELDKIYSDIFEGKKFKDHPENKENFTKRFNDISLERENTNIDNIDENLKNLLFENKDLKLEDIFEYLKYKKNNLFDNNIILPEIGTLDTLPSYNNNFSSFLDDSQFFESNNYTDISNINQLETTKFNKSLISDFNEWKSQKIDNKKLSLEEMSKYIEKRKEESDIIFKKVEINLSNSSKKKEVEEFLKKKYINEEINEYYNNDNNILNIENNDLHIEHIDINDEDLNFDDLLEEVELNKKIKKSEEIDINKCDNIYDFMEKVKIEELKNNDYKKKEKKELMDQEPSFIELKNSVKQNSNKITNVRKREFNN